jgi:hypothetical protein
MKPGPAGIPDIANDCKTIAKRLHVPKLATMAPPSQGSQTVLTGQFDSDSMDN